MKLIGEIWQFITGSEEESPSREDQPLLPLAEEQKSGSYHSIQVNTTLEQLIQLEELLQRSIDQQSSYWNFLHDTWLKYKRFFCGALVVTGTLVTTGCLLFYCVKFLNGRIASSLNDWNNLLSSKNGDLTCASFYNSLVSCVEEVEESGPSSYLLKGISADDDLVCYNALYNLCTFSCGAYHNSEYFPKDCHGEVLGQDIYYSLNIAPLGLLSSFLYVCVVYMIFYRGAKSRPSHEMALPNFLETNKEILEKTGLIGENNLPASFQIAECKDLKEILTHVQKKINQYQLFNSRKNSENSGKISYRHSI